MQVRARELFTTVRSEGALLPPELLQRVADGDRSLPGARPADYHLVEGESFGEAINRAWSRLQGAWSGFRSALEGLAEGDAGTSVTRERWLLVLLSELGYGRLPTANAVEIDGRSYPVSHAWGGVPIHLVGARIDLDSRTAGVAGAARQSPHSLVQELLNASDARLWGIVSNGRRLRLLRDNAQLTRQAFVEFDLETMMDAEVYSDFALLWLVGHQSRVEAERPEQCWLERWTGEAAERGTRARESLRQGVEAAISGLGAGFLAHPANSTLRTDLRTGALDTQDYYRQLLRLVYRLLFLFVAEDRDLLAPPDAGEAARERYRANYGTQRLRALAERRVGGRHPDLWRGLRLVMDCLGSDEGEPGLALPALGSFLWSAEAVPDLAEADLANRHLLDAVRELAFVEQDRTLRAVDYRNLGAEELGSIYESLLELHPELDIDASTFVLSSAAGSERKTTGSYYTPTSLIVELLDSALDPVLDRAAVADDPEAAILALKVCDPACGSGHFLIAAAQRIAKRLAAIRTGDAEPAPGPVRHALRDVISRCIYGVDVNEMAVELCKVSLWMEGIDPGRPLSFLDHRIVVGNSIISSTHAIRAEDQPTLGSAERHVRFVRQRALLEALPEESVHDIEAKASALGAFLTSDSVAVERAVADRWIGTLGSGKRSAGASGLALKESDIPIEDRAFARGHRALHWDIEFPEVFSATPSAPGSAGFDVVLGNPPWLSYSGRQAARLPDDVRAFLAARYVRGGWATSHGFFTLLAARDLGAGAVGLVLPEQVAHLPGYSEVRRVAGRAIPVDQVKYWGEGVFSGVTSPCITLTLRQASPRGQVCRTEGECVPLNSHSDAWVFRRLDVRPAGRTPWSLGKLVGDIGVHTGNCSKKLIRSWLPRSAGEVSVLEGRNIGRYTCSPPTKCLDLGYRPLEGEYFTIRPIESYSRAAYCIRQTAAYPIVGPRQGAVYFRNSLLALYPPPPGERLDVRFIVGVLNSDPMRQHYEGAVADAGQKAFPQVKVRALRALPMPKVNFATSDKLVHDEVVELVGELLGHPTMDPAARSLVEAAIDQRVGQLMGVDCAAAEVPATTQVSGG